MVVLESPLVFGFSVDEAGDEEAFLGVGGCVGDLGDEAGLGLEEGLEFGVVGAGDGFEGFGSFGLEDYEIHLGVLSRDWTVMTSLEARVWTYDCC